MTSTDLDERQLYRDGAARPLAPRNGGITSVVRQMRAERLNLALMRGAFAILAAVSILALLWMLPWFSIGLTWDSYSGSTAGAVILMALAALGCCGFLVVWGPIFRNEPLPEFLRVLFGGRQLIRGRQQFYSRLAAECRHARRDRRYLFSLIMIQRSSSQEQRDWLEPTADQDVAAMLVRGIVRSEDVVATAPGAVWVLVAGGGQGPRDRVARRLASTLSDFDLPIEVTGARAIGGSTFGEDGDTPELLVLAARQRLRRITELAPFEATQHDRVAA